MAAGTSGGGAGTGGGIPRRALLLAAATLLLSGSVNALSTGRDLPASVRAWEPWCWEMTSAVFWIAMLVPLWRLGRRLRPPANPWPRTLVLLLALTPLVTLLHAAWFDASRSLVYGLAGRGYRFDWRLANLIYEWRKDVLSVLAITGIGFLVDRLGTPPVSSPPAAPPFRLEVRDGNRTLFLAPGEISHAEAAGNYVELHTAAGPVLHRTTLAALEQELAPHGFVRIHRSRLVRRDAVTAIAATASGDFTVTLAGGAAVQGSRRFRGHVAP